MSFGLIYLAEPDGKKARLAGSVGLLPGAPDAPDVIVSTNRGEPVALDAASPIGEAYRAIARRITGASTAAPEIPREKTFFEKLFGSRS